jgi:hypothetical protein
MSLKQGPFQSTYSESAGSRRGPLQYIAHARYLARVEHSCCYTSYIIFEMIIILMALTLIEIEFAFFGPHVIATLQINKYYFSSLLFYSFSSSFKISLFIMINNFVFRHYFVLIKIPSRPHYLRFY